jgi:hypothetical protein
MEAAPTRIDEVRFNAWQWEELDEPGRWPNERWSIIFKPQALKNQKESVWKLGRNCQRSSTSWRVRYITDSLPSKGLGTTILQILCFSRSRSYTISQRPISTAPSISASLDFEEAVFLFFQLPFLNPTLHFLSTFRTPNINRRYHSSNP